MRRRREAAEGAQIAPQIAFGQVRSGFARRVRLAHRAVRGNFMTCSDLP